MLLIKTKKPRIKGYKKTEVDGITFDSKREARRYQELKLLKRAGNIRSLARQVSFYFVLGDIEIRYPPNKLGHKGPQMKYIADFEYYDCDKEEWIIEDSKGHRTDAYKLKRAIMFSMGHTILET